MRRRIQTPDPNRRRGHRGARACLVAGLLLLMLPMAAGWEIEDMTSPPEDQAPAVDEPTPPPDDPDRGSPATKVQVVSGADYWLPDWVEPETFGGYVNHPDVDGPGTAYRNW
jgi:hypothetical protein